MAHALLKMWATQLFFITLLSVGSNTVAEKVGLAAVSDNFISEEYPDNTCGGGDSLKVGVDENGNELRSLLKFDVSSIPAGAHITYVGLRLYLESKTGSGAGDLKLHPLTHDWSEGAKACSGNGIHATQSDESTWSDASYSSTSWPTPGGSFSPTESSARFSGAFAHASVFHYWRQRNMEATPPLIEDVQRWIDQPASNYGWILKADVFKRNTLPSHSVWQYASSESQITSQMPRLLIEYEMSESSSTITRYDQEDEEDSSESTLENTSRELWLLSWKKTYSGGSKTTYNWWNKKTYNWWNKKTYTPYRLSRRRV